MPLKSALEVAAELGVEAVEIDARHELPAPVSRTAVRQLLKWLDDYRLKVACLTFQIRHGLGDATHLDRRIAAIKDNMRLAYQLGCNSLICDIGEIPPPEQTTLRDQWVDVVNDIGRYGQREGAFLAAKTGIASPAMLAQFIQDCDTGSLMVDLDPGNLLLHGHSLEGVVPALGANILQLHVRDAVRDFAARRAIEVEVGRGSVDWSAILSGLEQHAFQGYATIARQESKQPQLDYRQACEYLQNLF